MYQDFYQLTSNPFRLAPDPNFCFNHSGYKRAREYLEYALDQGEGFVMVTGRPGTGKTMLVETFLRGIDISTVVAKRIAASDYGAKELLRAVAYAYGFDAADMDKATLRHRIQQYFLQQEQAGRRVLLIVDEAQTLQYTALEELRILADLQTESRQMLQLFLVGQESLQDLMSTPDMEQFQQRVIANYHLVPLSLMDARAYIEYRLLQAGWNGNPEFTSAAVLSIYQLSKGVPRHINKICNRLMLLGFGKGNHVFDKRDVQAISIEMSNEQLTPMEENRAHFTEADTISSIPEIRDGRLSIADLAIRADNVDAEVFAITEASRHAANEKAHFVDRHHGVPVVWNQQQSSSECAVDSSAAVTNQQASGSGNTASTNRHFGSALAEQLLSHFKWREAVMVTAATLAITTISIAALPSLLGNVPAHSALSDTNHPLRESRDTGTARSKLPGADATADNFFAERMTAPVVSGVSGTDEPEQRVTPMRHEGDTRVEAGGGVHSPETGDAVSAGSVLASYNPLTLQQPSSESLAPAGDLIERSLPGLGQQHMPVLSAETSSVTAVPGHYDEADDGTLAGDFSKQTQVPADDRRLIARVHTTDADLPQASSDLYRTSLAPPVSAGPVQTEALAVAAGPSGVSQDETIAELLSLGRQSLDEYRLLTPEDDNAYIYFRSVLKLDSDNEDAHAGIQEIVDRYVLLTRKAVNRRDHDRAQRYIRRGLSIQSGNRELLALQENIDRNPGSSPDGTAVTARHAPALQGSVSAKERAVSEGVMSRITTFFSNRKADAERGEVIVPAGWDG